MHGECKKRVTAIVTMAAVASGVLFGCGGGKNSSGPQTADKGEEGSVINFYIYQDDSKNMLNDYYPQVESVSDDGEYTYLKDGTTIHWIVNNSEQYQEKLDEALRDQDNKDPDDRVDMMDLEVDYVRKYIEAGVCEPLSVLGISKDDLSEQYPYTRDAVMMDEDMYGITWGATPGLFAYRRSIAKDVLGTDDPDEVQAALSDWDKFDEVAARAKEKGYYMLSGFADTYRVFSNNISQPWVSDNTTVNVDPMIMEWITRTKAYTDAGYNHKTINVFTDDWMKDQGADGKVFGFFYSTWGINFTLVSNAGEDGFGDWAVCKGPMPFFWGGSWYAAAKGTDNAEHIRDIMMSLCADKDIMKQYAIDTNNYENNKAAMDEIAADPSFGSDFLGGQNHIALFNEVAPTIDFKNIGIYDQGCTLDMIYTFADYFLGNMTLDEAKAAFETAIKERYPNLTEVVWP